MSAEPIAGPAPFEARIDQLGQEGDGICRAEAAPIPVRYALAGETVLATPIGRNRATLHSVLKPSPARVEPPCGLFGRCGGCVLQHQDRAVTLDWKRGLVEASLRSSGFTIPDRVAPTQSAPRTRRRVDLAIRRLPGGLTLGLHARGSDEVVDLTECHILDPGLFALLGRLRPALNRLQGLHKTGSLRINLLRSGPDLLLSTDGPLPSRDRAILAELARDAAIPRIAWQPEDGRADPEIVCQLAPVSHRFLGADPAAAVPAVAPPPGAFLQATDAGEAAIIEAVLQGLPPKLPRSARLAELYAGCGTLSFALAARARVAAFEGDALAAEALRLAGSGHRIEARTRDLNRQPLLARDLSGIAAIILDPPHAGAGAQMQEIARSLVPCVIYVSCNPTALAADTALLAEAGYQLTQVSVIDQFLWSARVESVNVFTRPAVVRRGPLPRPARG